MSRAVIQPGHVRIRHITRDDSSPRKLLGKGLRGTFDGANGRQGWQSGTVEDLLGADPGKFTRYRFPNAAGADGRLHRDRFALLTDPAYRPGDEWIEVYRDRDLLYVGTPVEYELSRSELVLGGDDGRGLLGKQRETAAGYIRRGPHDAIREMCEAWEVLVAQDFTDPAAPAMTLSAAPQVTSDGRFAYTDAESSSSGARLVSGGTASLQTTATIHTGREGRVWRAETTIARPTAGTQVTLTVGEPGAAPGDPVAVLQLDAGNVTATAGGAPSAAYVDAVNVGPQPVVTLAIEGRGRYVFFYLDGQLLACLPVTHQAADHPVTVSGTGSQRTIRSLLVRQRAVLLTPVILDPRLAGAPPATGLWGVYYSDGAIPADEPDRLFAPTREPYARRTDPTIDFATGAVPAWQPTGSAGDRLSVRWTGAIYLDLENTDLRLRVTADDIANVWVGDTRDTSRYITDPATQGDWLRTHLGVELTGWYPIIIEYANLGGAGGIILEAERSASPGAWVKPGSSTPGAPALSPYGVYETLARYDVHAEQIRQITDAYGLQVRLTPRSLESGEFPGRLEIAPRIGRDTDYVLDSVEATGIVAQGSAADVADTLICDGPVGSDGVAWALEALAHHELGEHVVMHQDSESLSDITDRTLLEQRASSLSALRASTWEEVSARPRGHRKLTDTFPLTGELAEFAWRAGDGLRVEQPEIRVSDQTCRQLTSVQWPTVPGGLGAPTVAFRQRPRGLRETLRALARRLAIAQRASTPS